LKKVKGYTLKDGEINKVVYMHDYEQMIEDMKLIKKTKIPLAKKNPFPDEDVLGELRSGGGNGNFHAHNCECGECVEA
jgi:hypothetical protein